MWFKSHRTRITAIVVDIEKNREWTQVSFGGGTVMRPYESYIIVARWTDPGTRQQYTFRSKKLLRNLKKFSKGSGISVLVDPTNPRRNYLVET